MGYTELRGNRAMPAQMTPAVMQGTTRFACVAWGWNDPSFSEAETALPIPPGSSATEQKILEEALYLKVETLSIASRYEPPISRAPSDVYVITNEAIRRSGPPIFPGCCDKSQAWKSCKQTPWIST
jgi:hypothetical protein